MFYFCLFLQVVEIGAKHAGDRSIVCFGLMNRVRLLDWSLR